MLQDIASIEGQDERLKDIKREAAPLLDVLSKRLEELKAGAASLSGSRPSYPLEPFEAPMIVLD